MSITSPVDVLILGAGAAGISAARRLRDAHLSVLLIEARARVGGRAWTIRDGASLCLDLGCGWLHSADRNPLVDVANQLRLSVDRSAPSWRKRADTSNFSEGDQAAFQAAHGAFYERLAAAARNGVDRAAADSLNPGCRWNPLIDAVSAYANGVGLSELSTIDFRRYEDSGVNWRIVEGYGALFERWARDLPVVLNCPVQLVDHSGPRVRVEGARGVFEADAIIVTAPTDVLARDAIRFLPSVPETLQAAHDLPLGADEKLFLAFDDAEEFLPDTRLLGATDSARTGAYALRPLGQPVIEGFFGGDLARELAEAGPDGFASFAIDQIASALGGSVRGRLRPIAASAWSRDPWSLGAYSHARIGRADARAKLAEPVNERLIFAGEACSPDYFTTAHGAAASGRRAADVLLATKR